MVSGGAVMRRSLAHVGALAHLSRSRSERLLAHAPRPCRRNHAHPENALHGAQEVNAAGDRPPAVARLLEEVASLQPALLMERRDIAVKPAAGDLEAEQREPVLQPVERDEIAGPGHRLLAAEIALDAEQAVGIEARDDELPFRPDHAMNLTQ